MKILLTGASGFLGKVLQQRLSKHHEVHTLGRSAESTWQQDLTHELPELPLYDMVIHAAGKAHVVPKTKEEERAFFQINHLGTKHLLKALERNPPRSFVFISSVAVYGREEGMHITEDIALDGTTPYALSKIKAEEEVQAWSQRFHVASIILRLPLIVGAEAPGNLGSMLKAIRKGYYVRIGRGETRRSMVLAQDVVEFIPSLLQKKGIYNLTDGIHPSFAQLEDKIAAHYHRKVHALPIALVRVFAKIGDWLPFSPINSYRLHKLTAHLTFSDEQARRELLWQPQSVLDADFF